MTWQLCGQELVAGLAGVQLRLQPTHLWDRAGLQDLEMPEPAAGDLATLQLAEALLVHGLLLLLQRLRLLAVASRYTVGGGGLALPALRASPPEARLLGGSGDLHIQLATLARCLGVLQVDLLRVVPEEENDGHVLQGAKGHDDQRDLGGLHAHAGEVHELHDIRMKMGTPRSTGTSCSTPGMLTAAPEPLIRTSLITPTP